MSLTTVTHTLLDAQGQPVKFATVVVDLVVSGFNSAKAEILFSATAQTDQTGTYTLTLTPNAQITPAGTYYVISHPGREQYSFTVPVSGSPVLLYDNLVQSPQSPAGLVVGVTQAQLTAGLAGKVDSTASPAGDPGTPVWKRMLTSALATTWANLQEVYVNSVLASWRNEWGALRGTSPYTTGDALVRAIRTATDGITGSASAVELVDRTDGVHSNTKWGLGWDGTVRVGGTNSAPAGSATVACVLVNHGASAPAGLPDGTLIFEKTT